MQTKLCSVLVTSSSLAVWVVIPAWGVRTGQYKPGAPPLISQLEPRNPRDRRHRESMGTPGTLLTLTLVLMVSAEVGRGYMMMQEDIDQEDDSVLQQLAELSARYCQPHLMRSINYRWNKEGDLDDREESCFILRVLQICLYLRSHPKFKGKIHYSHFILLQSNSCYYLAEFPQNVKRRSPEHKFLRWGVLCCVNMMKILFSFGSPHVAKAKRAARNIAICF